MRGRSKDARRCTANVGTNHVTDPGNLWKRKSQVGSGQVWQMRKKDPVKTGLKPSLISLNRNSKRN